MSNTKPQNQEAQRTLSRIFGKKKIEQIQTNKQTKKTQPQLSVSNSKIKKTILKQVRGKNPLPIEKQE